MEHLLYSSNEMFSSTQLVRKSKDIFDKLNKNEISKAVILRDGKPNFILLDFFKYEDIMKEYQELKDFYENNKNIKVNKNQNTNISNQSNTIEKKDTIQNNEKKSNEDEELLKALKQLEALNLDPELKKEAQDKLKEQPSGEIKEFWN